MTVKDWSKPTPINDATLAFPANAETDLMPPYQECLDGLDGLSDKDRKKWIEFQRSWFYSGLSEKTEFHCKEGIDGETAYRHLRAVQGSYQPKHQHKEAAVAYLCSLWFTKITKYEVKGK